MESQKSKCLICEESFPQKGLAFFKFPKDESRFKAWMKEISPVLDILKVSPARLKEDGRVCAKHFRDRDFINFKRNSLVRNACPNISVSDLNKLLIHRKKFSCNDINSDDSSNKIECQSFQKYEPAFNHQETDMFQCGRCKTQFQQLSDFMDHKRLPCKSVRDKFDSPALEKSSDFDNSLEKTFLISFENKLDDFAESSAMDPVPNESLFNIVTEESQSGDVVSFIVNDSKLVVDESASLLSSSGQIILTSKSPPEEEVRSVIVTTDVGGTAEPEVLYTCPIAIESPIVSPNDLAPTEKLSHVLLTESENVVSLDNYLLYNGDGVYQSTESTTGPTMGDDRESTQTTTTFLKIVSGQVPNGVIGSSEEKRDAVGRTKGKLTCSYCGKAFEKQFNLQQHERVHTGERPFQCVVCGRAFSQKSNVRKHMLRHRVWPQARQTLKLKADDVGQTTISQESLDQMNYSCQYCSMSFNSYSLYKKHLSGHSNFKVYRCIQKGCEETFNDLDEFLSHSKIHSSSAEFRCHICLKSYTSLEELGAHQYDHDLAGKDRRESEVKLKCEICHAQFKTAESLKNHMAVDTHNYECVHCRTVFSSERFLRRHLATHLDPSQSKFKCSSCKKTFRTEKYLNNHVFVHLTEKPFNCDHCDKQFASKYRLKRHLAIHLNQYFECPFKAYLGCFKTFYRKDKLRDHVTTHSNTRVRSCQVCAKSFSSLAKLTQHMRRDHKVARGKQVLKCLNCSQTFRKQKLLLQHHCTVGEKRFRSGGRGNGRPVADKSRSAPETTVSNIEIIMVPYVSKSEKCDENLNSVPE